MKATALLKRQHREVEALFGQVKKTTAPAKRRALLKEIETKLRAHMMIEEGIFYPAVAQGATGKKLRDMVPEAFEEHHVVQLVLDELPGVDPRDARFEAKMTVLEELIEHHVEEEEQEMFPSAEKQLGAEAMAELGEQMQTAMEDGAMAARPDAEADDEDADADADEEDEDEEEDDEDDGVGVAPARASRARPHAR